MQIDVLADVGHPIDVMETVAEHRKWPAERGAENELNLCVTAKHCDYQLAVSWRPDLGGLHVSSIFDMDTPDFKRVQLYELLARINAHLFLGHFDIWANGAIYFRTTLLVSDTDMTATQCDMLISHAVENCERFFPALQYLIGADLTPERALKFCLIETRGEA